MEELQLEDIELLVITEDSSNTEEVDDLKIKIVNIMEWLV